MQPYDMYDQKKFVETKEMVDLEHAREEKSFRLRSKLFSPELAFSVSEFIIIMIL